MQGYILGALARSSPLSTMEEKKRTPNDQRSDVHNPTSPEFKSAQDHHSDQYNPNSSAYNADANNRSNQMNPNNPAYRSSRSRK